MAKKAAPRITDTFETLKPYIERALTDEEFRNNVRAALGAAGAVYGGVKTKNGVTATASKLATDKDIHESLKRAFEELNEAGERLRAPEKKSHKGRNTVLLTGFIVGVFYNPWTGPQARQWLLDKIAGGDDLQPLESWDVPTAYEEAGGDEPAAAGAEPADDES